MSSNVPSAAPPPLNLQQTAPQQGGNPAPYDFILNNPAPSKKPRGLGGGSMQQRILLAVIGGGILLILIIVGFSLILGGGSDFTEKLANLAQSQTELIRVADIGTEKARGSEAKNLAITTSLSVSSDLNKVQELLDKRGNKLGAKQLILLRDSKTDEALEQAALNNLFDETFIETMSVQLNTYQSLLQDAYSATNSTSEKQILADAFNNAVLLSGEETAQE